MSEYSIDGIGLVLISLGLLSVSFILGVLLKTNGWIDAVAIINQRIFDTTLDLILVVDSYGRFIRVSPSCYKILGYTKHEMDGHLASEFLYEPDLENTREEMRIARYQKQTRNFECRYVHKNGSPIILWWTGVWSEPEHQFFFIGRDITEQRHVEEQLRQSQKMEAIGNLTGGMAHDFNNLLGVIFGCLDAAMIKITDVELKALITEALDAASSAGELTRSLLAFARRQTINPQSLQINQLIKHFVWLLRRTLGEKIEIKTDLDPNLWFCTVDPALLEATLTNLATNARDAMPNGGRLLITTNNRFIDDEYAGINSEVIPGDYVAIEITDTGIGIPADSINHIFEPFFTTKESGHGTGLGLSMVFGFMKQSNGHISVYSEPGVGTIFRLYFPRVITATETSTIISALHPHHEIVNGNGEIILVVEDNERLRRVVMNQLQNLGYQPIPASGSQEALMFLEQHKVDVLFTDIVMPGEIDGIGLAKLAFQHWPDMRVLLTSGFPGGLKLEEEFADKAIQLLAKPYRLDELSYTIQMVLNTPAPFSDK